MIYQIDSSLNYDIRTVHAAEGLTRNKVLIMYFDNHN